MSALDAIGITHNTSVDTDNPAKPVVRSLEVIAREVYADWSKQGTGVNFAAKPYLLAMGQLGTMADMYGCDSAKSIMLYFLSNAQSWRGETAKRVKAELKKMAGVK